MLYELSVVCTYRLISRKSEPNMCMDYIQWTTSGRISFATVFFMLVSFRSNFCEQSLCDILNFLLFLSRLS